MLNANNNIVYALNMSLRVHESYFSSTFIICFVLKTNFCSYYALTFGPVSSSLLHLPKTKKLAERIPEQGFDQKFHSLIFFLFF